LEVKRKGEGNWCGPGWGCSKQVQIVGGGVEKAGERKKKERRQLGERITWGERGLGVPTDQRDKGEERKERDGGALPCATGRVWGKKKAHEKSGKGRIKKEGARWKRKTVLNFVAKAGRKQKPGKKKFKENRGQGRQAEGRWQAGLRKTG